MNLRKHRERAAKTPRKPPIHGDAARIRGAKSEARVAQALQYGRMPIWMHRFRKATLEEEPQGIDFVVDTPVGPLYLQVKTSYRAAIDFVKDRTTSRSAKPIGVVAVGKKCDSELANEVRKALVWAYEQVCKKRGGW